MLSSSFEHLARELLATLHQVMGFDLWMITRVEDQNWIILQAEDHGYGVTEGSIFNWADSFCYQMVLGNGPCIAPSIDNVDAYVRAPIGRRLQIGAYAGVPLVSKDGSLFGTLCAIHPTPLPQSIEANLPLITAISKLLVALIDAKLESAATLERAVKAETALLKDSLTGVFNRRAWDRLLLSEEELCVLLGHSACVIVIDLDHMKSINDTQGHVAGDGYLCRTVQGIKDAISLRPKTYLARTGGDEFAILCVECDLMQGKNIVDRIRSQLSAVDASASIGLAIRTPSLGLFNTWKEADMAMYGDKRSKERQLSIQASQKWN